jgi:choline dehydrogenase-like flavoprotein
MGPETREESRLRRYLASIATLSAIGFVLSGLTSLFHVAITPAGESISSSDVLADLGVIFAIAWVGSADVRRFRPYIGLLIVVLILNAAILLVSAIIQPVANVRPVSLLTGIAFAALAIALGGLLSRTNVIAPVLPWPTEKPVLIEEQIGGAVLGVLGAGSLILAAAALFLAAGGTLAGFAGQPFLLAGLVTTFLASSALAFLAVRNIRRYDTAVTLLVIGSALAFVTPLIILGIFNPIPLILAVFLFALSWWMTRARLDYLGYLWPNEYRAVEALADAIVPDLPEPMPSHQVALTLDRYLSSFPSSRLVLTRLAVTGLELAPLVWLKPPLSLLSPAERRKFIDRRFKEDLSAKEGRTPILDLLRTQLQGALRIGMQAVYLSCYSDRKVQRAIGYTPFSQRFPDHANVKKVRKYPPLVVTTPNDVRRLGIDVIANPDVVIIGSGAGGSILAEQLLAQGRDVLMLEKGLFVDPDDFTEDEVQQIGRLYADGALQVAQSYRFQVLQGNCVGGGTVVNNAVCFETPERVLSSWNDPLGANAGIDEVEYRKSQEWIKERMMIQSIKTSSKTRPWPDVLNQGDRAITQGIEAYGLKPGDEYEVVRANIADCLGCGYCNIGCKYGRKLSMLDEVLPRAQRDHGADRFRIFSEAQAVKLDGSGPRINEIVVQLRDGRQLLVRNPSTVVVSAATVGSSWLLLRSGIGQGDLPIGRHLGFNFGSPLHGYWPPKDGRHLDSFDGLQIAHYIELAENPGFVMESWFNPPVAQAMAMPGWLDQHERNMRLYRDLSAVGVLVGSETNASIKAATLLRGTPDIDYHPTQRDLDTLVNALIILGQIMFAGGAQEVMPSTMSYKRADERVFKGPDDLQRLRKIVRDDRDIVLGTGHPQGGNAISKTRGKDRGVIDPEFRVYGYDNLFVCDGSVFPSPTIVNPQLSIMTMAHYAAKFIGQSK